MKNSYMGLPADWALKKKEPVNLNTSKIKKERKHFF